MQNIYFTIRIIFIRMVYLLPNMEILYPYMVKELPFNNSLLPVIRIKLSDLIKKKQLPDLFYRFN
jgi:hypothetical protein